MQDKLDERSFLEKNPQRLRKVTHTKDVLVYIENKTNYCWYFDSFHKDNKAHYEVFNSNGNHVGEANLDGIVDTTKRDKKKKFRP